MAVDSLQKRDKFSASTKYEHARWELRRRFLRFLIRTIGLTLLAKFDRVEGLENVPREGPAILLINHIAFIDPIVVLHVVPRNIVPLAKIEVYDYPVIGIFPRLWGVIPIRRDEFDRRAVQQVMEVIRAGEIVLVAPEGTRSPQLSQGKEGIAYLAGRSGLRSCLWPWTDPGFPPCGSARVGGPGATVTSAGRFASGDPAPPRNPAPDDDEAMYILASMLPEGRRGVYGDLSKPRRDH
jgi:1-acyl-sn-glycerol-3-phosphate acyltransferase